VSGFVHDVVPAHVAAAPAMPLKVSRSGLPSRLALAEYALAGPQYVSIAAGESEKPQKLMLRPPGDPASTPVNEYDTLPPVGGNAGPSIEVARAGSAAAASAKIARARERAKDMMDLLFEGFDVEETTAVGLPFPTESVRPAAAASPYRKR